MNMFDLLQLIPKDPSCEIYPAAGSPVIEQEHFLPEDLQEFYRLCGGALLYAKSEYPYRILSPAEFVLANPVLIGERAEYDITGAWYLVTVDPDNQYLTIDCSKERLGKCYDSFIDRHGIVGNCPVIANSFHDLLVGLINNRGGYPYWLRNDFASLGDAYDGV
ncbi:MAG: SMI1/KNR4 family protein [Caldilinea sp. CFX5]|nr:SMI1/KNR4 family protein [Caldilinea sp. CFX5]